VDVAQDGLDAMEKIRTAHYDLVLLDQMMPGLSGLDLLRLLRATYSPSDLPIIMVTAVDQGETAVEALNGGANDYIVKPIDMPVIAARIQAQLARSKADRAVRDNQQRLSLAAQGSQEGLWDCDLVNGFVQLSPRCAAILGLQEEDPLRNIQFCADLIHPEDLPRVRAALQAHLENHTPEFQIEHRIRNKSGEYHWVLTRGGVLFSSDGKAIRVSGSLTDISATKFVDALTGLGNRRMLLDRLAAVLKARSRFSLLLLDLDGFKVLNDSFGPSPAPSLPQSSIAFRAPCAFTASRSRSTPISA
jgi:PAS domain S-box-containing protein